MTVDPCGDSAMLVQAELDGELDAAEALHLSAHLETCPDCAALRTELAALSARLRDGVTRHVAPASLRAAIPVRLPEVRRPVRPAWGHAISFGAGLAAAAVVALAVLPAHGDLAGEIVSAHIRALQPGHLVDVESTDQHTVKPWFDGRLDFAPTVRDLAPQGFPLAGARLDYLAGHPVAALVYRRRLHVIDVFVWPSGRAGSDAAVQGYRVVAWVQDGLSYQAVSDLNGAELAEFVQLLRAPGP